MGRGLFGLACCVVLALTFLLGVLVGRQWARSSSPLVDDTYAGPGRDDDRDDWIALDQRERRPAPGAAGGAGDVQGGRRLSPGARVMDDEPRRRPGRGERPAAGGPSNREGAGARGGADEPGRPGGRDATLGARASSNREGPGARAFDDRAAAQIQEKLTFFHTLSAPLAAGPPPVAEARPRTVPAAPGASPTPSRQRRPPSASEAYTVQVAALTTREQADALRERLGEGAYVIELDGASPGRYRVRVGMFGSRAEADAVAARLRADHSLTPFVTAR
jgi:hypothetical protein